MGCGADMDQIILRGLPFFGHHGVMPEETVTGQRFVVNVCLYVDLREAGRTDEVSATVDYAKVYALVKEVVEGRPRRLIETVAESIAQRLLASFGRLTRVDVEVEKPGAPIPGVFDHVSVKITRERD